jgi:hypothetical protein
MLLLQVLPIYSAYIYFMEVLLSKCSLCAHKDITGHLLKGMKLKCTYAEYGKHGHRSDHQSSAAIAEPEVQQC